MQLEQLYQKALNFDYLTIEEGMFLFENAPLAELSYLADTLRKKQVPHGKVTWQIDRNLNTTNVCIANCKFCNFYRIPGHAEAYITDIETYKKKIEETIAYGGDQVMHQPITESALKKYTFLNSPYAFIVTRVQKDKNIEMMLEAFSDNPSMPFVIIGNWEATNYGRKVKAIYQNIKSIHLISPIYDKYELDLLRSNCTIYVHGHSAGGTNPTLVEAMSLGLPIVAFANGFNEYSTFNKAKYFSDASELKQLIDRYEDFDLKEIGKKMFELASTHYRWEKVTSD